MQRGIQFDAKRDSKWCKVEYNLMQSGIQFDAKRNSIWCKEEFNLMQTGNPSK